MPGTQECHRCIGLSTELRIVSSLYSTMNQAHRKALHCGDSGYAARLDPLRFELAGKITRLDANLSSHQKRHSRADFALPRSAARM